MQRAFCPPFCPYPECATQLGEIFVWVRNGWHETERAPFRVQRFRCQTCKRTFSTQTFHESYWKRRPELDQLIFNMARSCAGNRQIATALKCGKSTVAEKIRRLALQAIRFQVCRLRNGPLFTGDLLFDGLGTFEHSQYWPYWLNLALNGGTSFIFGVTDSPLRRSGTMKPHQRRKRAILEQTYGRPDPRAVRRGTAELLAAIKPFLDMSASRLVSDRHRDYPLAIRDAGLTSLPHETVSGSDQRTAANPLFEINLADMSIRHGQSTQKRETIAFSKRRQGGIERAWLWLIWKNYMAPRRAKRRNGATPAMLANIADRRLGFDDIFGRRILAREVELPAPWARQVAREVFTPAVGRNRTNDARRCN